MGRIVTIDRAWFLGWAIASSAWCLASARHQGATYDEPFYVAAGLEGWRSCNHTGLMKLGTMPLPVDVQTFPLWAWERLGEFRIDTDGDFGRILPRARAGNLVFWWLLLAYALRVGRSLGGPWGGRLALAFLACEPSMLAHASLATTDLAASACLLAFLAHYREGRDAGGWGRRIAFPALWFGLLGLAKASGPIFGAIGMVAIDIGRRLGTVEGDHQGQGPIRHLLWSAFNPADRRDWLRVVLPGLGLTVGLCGTDWEPEPGFLAWARGLPPGWPGRAMTWVAEHLRVFPNGLQALGFQFAHNIDGHPRYLLGISGSRPLWYYYPALLTIKLSLPLLALPVVLGVVRRRSLANWACAVAVALLAFSLICRVQIGIRLVLPMVAVAAVGLGAAASRAIQGWRAEARSPRGSRFGAIAAPSLSLAIGLGLAWTATESARTWPDGLRYVNAAWGGPAEGYRLVSDSNYDWGQGARELERWRVDHGTGRLAVWYFGTDPAILRSPNYLNLNGKERPEDAAEAVRTRFWGSRVAVSTTMLYGPYREAMPDWISLLKSRRPVDRTSTFLIYDFSEPGSDAVAARPGLVR